MIGIFFIFLFQCLYTPNVHAHVAMHAVQVINHAQIHPYTENNHSKKKFVLLTSLSHEKNFIRMLEYCRCLNKNVVHPMIDQVHVLYDTTHDDNDTKLLKYLKSMNVAITYVKGRPTYKNFFDLANTSYPHKNIIVCDGDMYFNETLHALENYDLNNKFLALTQWEVTKNGALEIHKEYDLQGNFSAKSYASQDACIFCTPLKKFTNDNIAFGDVTTDQSIAYQAWMSHLQVFNPCLSIQCCHLSLTKSSNRTVAINNKEIIKILEWRHID